MTVPPLPRLTTRAPARSSDDVVKPAEIRLTVSDGPSLPDRPSLGRHGEDLVADLLSRSGWTVLARNWRPRTRGGGSVRGELDVVARRGGRAVVFEVKTRSGKGFGHPAEAVGREKLRRLHLLARAWAAENRWPEVPRVDVVAVLWPPGRCPLIEHYESIGIL